MPRYRETLLASTTQTVNGTGAVLDLYALRGVSSLDRAVFYLNVTAASGTTPTLQTYVQMEMPDGTTWADLGAFTQMVAVGKRLLSIPSPQQVLELLLTDAGLALGSGNQFPLGPRYRAKWVIGGVTPSFTFAVTADIYE